MSSEGEVFFKDLGVRHASITSAEHRAAMEETRPRLPPAKEKAGGELRRPDADIRTTLSRSIVARFADEIDRRQRGS
jgi:hypothetical protein